VQLGDISEVMLASTVSQDLVLVFAELLENATSFSPPESIVEVDNAFLADGSCQVRIVDYGIGMNPERMAEENGRLIERERLDVAPTSVLGLFVVGRLARRHSLTVELSETPGGGVTARVTIPFGLFSHIMVPQPVEDRAVQLPTAQSHRPIPFGTVSRPAVARPMWPATLPELNIPPATTVEGFYWFPSEATPPALPPGQTAAAYETRTNHTDAVWRPPVGEDAAQQNRGSLQRRVPGAQLPEKTVRPRPDPSAGHPKQDATAVRAAFDGFQSAVANAADPGPTAPPGVPPSWPEELARRIPGANLAPGLRKGPARPRPAHAAVARTMRDPEAERSAFEAFTTGLARAGTASPDASRDMDQTREAKE
jgi:hypothetical protein